MMADPSTEAQTSCSGRNIRCRARDAQQGTAFAQCPTATRRSRDQPHVKVIIRLYTEDIHIDFASGTGWLQIHNKHVVDKWNGHRHTAKETAENAAARREVPPCNAHRQDLPLAWGTSCLLSLAHGTWRYTFPMP